MPRSIFYRVKTPQGAWTRATGTPPFTISGLTAGTVYEIDIGDGVIIERTPLDAVSNVAPTVTASDSLAGRTLTITVDDLTGVPTPSTALTTLTLGGVDVSGDATGSGPWTYEVPSAQAEQTVAWTVTATNSEGSDTSSGSEVVAEDQVPTISTAPAITGTLAVGQTASVSNGTWNGDVDSYAYQWTANGTPISGASASTYAIQAADEGATLGCQVTATNAAGASSPSVATGGGTVAASATYSPSDFSSDDGLTVTSVTQSGDDWIVSMTDGTDTAEATFTSAQMEGSNPLLVRAQVITESPAGTFNASDSWWIWPSSGPTPEFLVSWDVNGTSAGTGASFTPTGAQVYEQIDHVVTESIGGQVSSVAVQAEAPHTLQSVTMLDTARRTYEPHNATGPVTIVAGSVTLDAAPVDNYFADFLNSGSNTVFSSASSGRFFATLYGTGSTLLATLSSNANAAGTTVCFVLLVDSANNATFVVRNSSGTQESSGAALAGAMDIGTAFRFGRVGGVAFDLIYHRVAFWNLASNPSRTASQILADLFDADTCYPRAVEIGNYYLGQPIVDVDNTAQQINTGVQNGSYTGTPGEVGSFVDA